MHTNRHHFDTQLAEVKQFLTKMGVLVETCLAEAMLALQELDSTKANAIIEGDLQLNRMEEEIDTLCINLIATQQPVATDLRKLIAALRIASSLERMGDLAVDVAKVARRLSGQTLMKQLIDLPQMAQIAQHMIRDGIRSYIDGDVELARQMCAMDDQVDALFKKVVNELFERLHAEVEQAEQAMHLCFVARYLERIADHATNIGENIVYISTGKKLDLNQ